MNFQEWYKKYWPGYRTSVTATQYSEDQHRAMIAWAAAKDFNPVNLQDLEYICEAAISHFVEQDQTIWIERAQKYRERLLRLAGEIPG